MGVTPPNSCTKTLRVPQSTCACVPGLVSTRRTGRTFGSGARRRTNRCTTLYDHEVFVQALDAFRSLALAVPRLPLNPRFDYARNPIARLSLPLPAIHRTLRTPLQAIPQRTLINAQAPRDTAKTPA